MYTGATAGTIRRLIDKRKDSISFVRLLMEVKKHPACFSREQYKLRFGNSDLPPGYLGRDYDKLVGKGKNEPHGATIDREVEELLSLTENLKEYVDERVAHAAREQNATLPTYQHLDDTQTDYLKSCHTIPSSFRGSVAW